MTRQRTVEGSFLVQRMVPLLHEAMPHIAHAQIRNRGTIGGSLAHADPAAELPALAVALDARMYVRSVTDARWVAARDFYVGLFATAMLPDEMLSEVVFPSLPPRSGWAFEEVARQHGNYAMCGAAAVVVLDERGGGRKRKARFFSASGKDLSKQLRQLQCWLANSLRLKPFGQPLTPAAMLDIDRGRRYPCGTCVSPASVACHC